MRKLLSFALLLGLLVLSCIEPNHTDAVERLGPEVKGIEKGPTHRAGQPCTVCHGGLGPGEPDFVAGGTVYDRRGSTVAMPDVTVVLTDSRGATFSTTTNEVGNFYVEAKEWQPVYPVFVELQLGGLSKVMKTRIGRDAGCATCHQGAGDARHMPGVYLKELTDP